MDIRAWARLAVVPLVGGAGLVAPAAVAAVAAPTPVTEAAASELYVSNKDCAAGGGGSMDAPYCTISAAVAAAQPGQTVLVQPGDYPEAVTVDRSGTETAPITIRAVNGPGGTVRVGNTVSGVLTGPVVTLAGVHDVRVEGFRLVGYSEQPLVLVDGATRVTVDSLDGVASRAAGTVRVTGASADVTVSRNFLANLPGHLPSVAVEAGVTGAVVVNNELSYGGVRVSDAPGAVVTNNTVVTNCRTGVDVIGASTGVSVRNNIVRTNQSRAACSIPGNATAISVAGDATEGTVVDHNLIDPVTGGALYSWGGESYVDLAAFRQATGQAGHDVTADPLLVLGAAHSVRPHWTVSPQSPAVDSADDTAPGVAATDFFGNARADNPDVANTGTGSRYVDRGAVEAQGGLRNFETGIRHRAGAGPLTVTANAGPLYMWPTRQGGSTIAYRFDGERYWRVTSATTQDHSFRRAGAGCVQTYSSLDGFRTTIDTGAYQACTILGALYTPVAPTRVLDTRSATGVATTTPVPANSEIVLSVPSVAGVPATDITALVLNVTVTRPTAAGFITVYPDGTKLPTSSNVNYVAKETVPNLVTVPMSNGKIRIRNTGSGTVHLVADLQGFYGRQGSGLKPLAPTRVLDTRTGAGTPIAANSQLRLDLSGRLPADATAVVLNVTVTRPTANGVLTVYPDGSPVPVASSLNFVTGQTIPNLVMVPVTAGRVLIRNASSGTTHVVADLAGYFGSATSGADQLFVPVGPYRVADTRNGYGWENRPQVAPLSAYEKARFVAAFQGQCAICPRPTAAVLNLTVTAPTAAGVLTGYPAREQPPTASNVNFVAGETASNAALVKADYTGRIEVLNNSKGSTGTVVDQSGYFIAPA
ncbi:right-handed parallel beta-helix repeat-containing protein [Micromonospora sp. NPDC050200]|uniref:right-handed parallel beta-helix repeat-containing protein n=1 Tax=Micromonospora sp. NPDC050200 TaxID=3155664 RepID=UPI0033F842F7